MPPRSIVQLLTRVRNRHLLLADMVLLPKTGHATFYERPDLFMALLLGFFSHRQPIRLP